jgi:hypothetical protein
MTEQESYKKSCDLWIESQKRLIKENKMQLKFAKKDLKLTRKNIIQTTATLAHEKNRLNEFLTRINNK